MSVAVVAGNVDKLKDALAAAEKEKAEKQTKLDKVTHRFESPHPFFTSHVADRPRRQS